MSIDSLSRYEGAMLGLAAGDALGTTLEFKRPGTFQPVTDMVGGGPFDLEPGQWTDDTSMALCLAESLIECHGFDPVDQLSRYLRWEEQGYLSSNGTCFDIGGTVNSALKRFRRTREPYCGPDDPMTAGNGSIMRLAPIPLYYSEAPLDAIVYSGKSSETTHRAAEAIDACRFMSGLLVGAVQGASKEQLLSQGYCPVEGLWEREPLAEKIAEIAAGSYKRRNPPEIAGTGYVVKSLEAALWAFYSCDNFKDGALLAVNLGNDADTTGAVYGQIAGAYYGAEAIPAKWRDKLALKETIQEFARELMG